VTPQGTKKPIKGSAIKGRHSSNSGRGWRGSEGFSGGTGRDRSIIILSARREEAIEVEFSYRLRSWNLSGIRTFFYFGFCFCDGVSKPIAATWPKQAERVFRRRFLGRPVGLHPVVFEEVCLRSVPPVQPIESLPVLLTELRVTQITAPASTPAAYVIN